jgi:hypothetical protein
MDKYLMVRFKVGVFNGVHDFILFKYFKKRIKILYTFKCTNFKF